MDETLLFPSPNWFQPSGLAVSPDNWLIYGGPSKSLCVLEPLPEDYDPIVQSEQGYTAHVVNRAHPEKIVCVDICPEWPEKRAVLAGSADGAVKQWSLEYSQRTLKIKSTHSHEIHSHEKEEVAGVGYCSNGYAVTVGSFGTIVKWDVNSNVAKSFNHVLKNFKPVCMACSPHIHMTVAIGTKQGVVFVLDLNGSPRITYKVRGQDDEIIKISWCPQYEVAVRKALKELDKMSKVTSRMENIRKETEPPEVMKVLDERVKNSFTTDKPVLINEKAEPTEEPKKESSLDESGIGKTLPEDSFDETVVQEDDMFDIYKDHEADEFGHKKYQPEDILVKVVEEAPKEDYLTECQKLKEEILKRKKHAEATVTELVDAMSKASVEDNPEASSSEAKAPEVKEETKPVKAVATKPDAPVEGKIIKGEVESSVHIHKHLLATIGKHGSIRVWSKSGKLVGSCSVASAAGPGGGGARGGPGAGTILWQQPDVLLIADGKAQLLDCNPLRIDCKNKLEWRVVHSLHKRGVFSIASGAPRVQSPGEPARDWPVWTAAQDRSLISYRLKARRAVHRSTCGGFLYCISTCPYDANKVAISVGDGAIRVWETETVEGDGDTDGDGEGEGDRCKLAAGRVTAYWYGVQGKVLTHAWHPTREGLLAFATAEARVGLLNTGGGGGERATRGLVPALGGPVYSLCWGEDYTLYAVGNNRLVAYDATKPDDAPVDIPVSVESQQWAMSAARWAARGLAVGGAAGGVAVLASRPPYDLQAAVFVYSKMLHTLEWHPRQTSSGEAPEPLRDLLAACSLDKANSVALLHYNDSDGSKELTVWKTLVGHKGAVLQLMWSPHHAEQLLSTSADGTVRVWDVSAEEGCCVGVFGGHRGSALGAAWAARPALAALLSGGADCALRLWRRADHTPQLYQEMKQETTVEKKKRNKKEKKESKKEKPEDASSIEAEDTAAAVADSKVKYSRRFLLPMIYKQTHPCSVKGPRRMLRQYLQRVGAGAEAEAGAGAEAEYGIDYIKLFGNINDVNEVLDTEMEMHEDRGMSESRAVLCIVRGYIDAVTHLAAANNRLDPFLLSIAPSVSFKYWKDTTLLYIQQIDRLIAKGEESSLNERPSYGGAIYRKVCVQLSLHDVKEAVTTLLDARLFADAYVLSRTRYMDSLAEHTLRQWAQDCLVHGQFNLAAVCFIALGDLSQAAAALGKSSDEESLCLAADIAKVLGQTTFAGHIAEKRELIKSKKEAEKEKEELKVLPSRTELATKNAVEVSGKVPEDEITDKENVVANSESPVASDTKVNDGVKNTDVLVDKENVVANSYSPVAIDTKDNDGVKTTDVPVDKDNDDAKSDSPVACDTKVDDEVVRQTESALGETENVIDKSDDTTVTATEALNGDDKAERTKEVTQNGEAENDETATVEDKRECEPTDEGVETTCAIKDAIDEVAAKTEIESTEQLLNDLPSKMEGLLRDSNQNAMHKGDGDTIQNTNEKPDIVTKVLENDQNRAADVE